MKLKQLSWASLGAAALILSAGAMSQTPVLANIQAAIAENLEGKPKVDLNLSAQKQVRRKDEKGQESVTWTEAGDQLAVQPGNILRYTLNATNQGNSPVKQLVLTQPVPQGTQYVLQSAEQPAGLQATYSIDGGRTFALQPMAEILLPDGRRQQQPAPASAYTHIRWQAASPFAARSQLRVAYQVKVN
jgi:uncharacterized repeat protein (TIGR01451 family)